MRKALVVTSSLGLVLLSCGDKRAVRAAVPPPPAPQAPASQVPAPQVPTPQEPAPQVPASQGSVPIGVEVGLASWYGHPYHGRASASGEVYDMEQFTAAHRTLPFGTLVRVVNLENNKTVDVRINDRGPFVDDRIIDLSHAAARSIDLIGPGTARVRLEVLQAPAMPEPDYFTVQVGAFQNRDNAERLRAEMEARYGAARLALRPGDPQLWRVLVGRAATVDDAGALAGRIRAEQNGKLGQAFVIRDDVANLHTAY